MRNVGDSREEANSTGGNTDEVTLLRSVAAHNGGLSGPGGPTPHPQLALLSDRRGDRLAGTHSAHLRKPRARDHQQAQRNRAGGGAHPVQGAHAGRLGASGAPRHDVAGSHADRAVGRAGERAHGAVIAHRQRDAGGRLTNTAA